MVHNHRLDLVAVDIRAVHELDSCVCVLCSFVHDVGAAGGDFASEFVVDEVSGLDGPVVAEDLL